MAHEQGEAGSLGRRLCGRGRQTAPEDLQAQNRCELVRSDDTRPREGTQVPDSASVTLKEAGDIWLASCANLERVTRDGYEQYLRLHIAPFIGREKLSKLTVAFVRAFDDKLREEKRSEATIRTAVKMLGSILGEAQERNLVVRNVAREMAGRRKRGNGHDRRHKRKLKVGIDIPTPEEIR